MLFALNSLSFQATAQAAALCASSTLSPTFNHSYVEGFLDAATQCENSSDVEPYLAALGAALTEVDEPTLAETAQQFINQLDMSAPILSDDIAEQIEEFFGLVRNEDSTEKELSYVDLLANDDQAMSLLRAVKDGLSPCLALKFQQARQKLGLITDNGSLRPGVEKAVREILRVEPHVVNLLALDDSLRLHATESIEALANEEAIATQVEATRAIRHAIHSALTYLGVGNEDPLELMLLEALEIADPLLRAAQELLESLNAASQSPVQVVIDEEVILSPEVLPPEADAEEFYTNDLNAASSTTLGIMAGDELEAAVFRDLDRAAQLNIRLMNSLQIFIKSV